MKITSVHAREILDSRGNPTVEVDVTLERRRLRPRGRAVGRVDRRARSARAARRRQAPRYGGKGVRKAVGNVNRAIAKAIVNRELDQRALDEAMIALDGTPTKSELGANAILGVSMAAARARCRRRRACRSTAHLASLRTAHGPVHAARADDEHPERRRARRHQRRLSGIHGDAGRRRIVLPKRCAPGAEIFHALRGILKARGQSTGVGDEGGFAPNLKSNREAIEVVLEAIGKAGMHAGQDVFIALDVAASELSGLDGGRKYVFQEIRRARSHVRTR